MDSSSYLSNDRSLFGVQSYVLMLLVVVACISWCYGHGILFHAATSRQVASITFPEEPIMLSALPSFRVDAIRQPLQRFTLRRIDPVLMRNDDNLFDDAMVLMDKVIVIPKAVRAIPKDVV